MSRLSQIKVFIKKIAYKGYVIVSAFKIKILNRRYILLLTPFHGNLGDHAIAAAEEQFVKRGGFSFFEVDTMALDHNEALFGKLIPRNRVILITGGGFAGSLWPYEEYRIRRVLEAFPENKVVVFPQTVTFFDGKEPGNDFFEESKRVYSNHKDLTFFVRDEKSFNFMKENMPVVNVKLAPDMVTALRPEIALPDKRSGIVCCFRKDLEKKISKETEAAIKDYLTQTYPEEKITYTDTVEQYFVNASKRKKELDNKLLLFGGSKLVVTDRLHGMIMAAIMNTPCIAFGNINGKVKGVYSWIKDNEFIKYVDTFDEFKEALDSLDLNKIYNYQIDGSLFAEVKKALGVGNE
ncbi:MAG: polysaccharide pyruvyl transferase family protein [Lachnospiraceae bacterium]|nr:polysaccharide pyruvyl transferase family protein [Lachnospiraceae bacterium]